MADEEVTDLTEEESDSDGKNSGKKAKGKGAKTPKEKKQPKEKETKEKEPKEAKEKSPRAKKEKGGRKGGGGASIILVMLVIALILVGSFVTALYFDIFSSRQIMADYVRDPLLGFIIWLDPSFHTVNQQMRDEAQARTNQLDARKAELDERDMEVTQRESLADTRETQLDRRASELNNFEEELREMYERITPLYRRATPQDIEEMQSIASTFSRMAPEEAADILWRIYTIEDTASILFYMGERNAAAIMAVFDPDFAAEITNVWLYS